jgi:hypothetical protein
MDLSQIILDFLPEVEFSFNHGFDIKVRLNKKIYSCNKCKIASAFVVHVSYLGAKLP